MEAIKNLFHKVAHNFMLVYFIVILIIIVPTALTKPSLSFRNAIVTAVGIDESEQGVDVSVLTLSQISQGDNKENNKLVVASGSSVASALGALEIRLGRKVQMGHVKFVVISETLAQKNDISVFIDNFIRTSRVSNTVTLVVCEDKAQKILDSANKLSESSSYNLSEIISNDYNDTFTKESSIDYFYKGYFSPNKTSSVGYISMTSNPNQGLIVSDEQQGGQGQSSSSDASQNESQQTSQNKEEILSFNRQIVVFKNGKMDRLLTMEEVEGINWITSESTRQHVKINNLTDEPNNLYDANLVLEVHRKSVQTIASFENQVPIITYKIRVDFNTLEINQKNDNISNNNILMSPKLSQAINDEAKKQFGNVLNKLKADNADIMEVYAIFNSAHNKKFQKFLKDLKNPDDYLKYIQFQLDVYSDFE